LIAVAAAGLHGPASAQSEIDTMVLVPEAPDSYYVERRGTDVVIGWYPPADSIGRVIGSRDFTNWYGEHTSVDGVNISFTGFYTTGWVDRQILVEKFNRDTYEVGVSVDIPMRILSVDMFDRTFERIINLGTAYTIGDSTYSYTPGDPIPMVLTQIGLRPGETPLVLDLGFNIHFSAGIVDTSQFGGPATFALDVQDFEGFHVWRGLSPFPSEHQAIVEISKEDYFKVSNINAIEDVPRNWQWLWEYFNDNIEPAWPRQDDRGRWYYEWIDDNAFAGFTYYYNVTTFDRGFFRGFNTWNKRDNFVCDEDPENPETPGQPVLCEDVVLSFEMTVNTGSDINSVYAVPNPYRTGTSEQTTSYYHNYPDRTIKFFNMPSEATIKIYTVSGDLVWEGQHSSPDGTDGIVSWDTKNRNGQEVGSGVYIFRVEASNDQDVYGRLVVIR
jgi:hypothetical protein